MTRHMQIYSTVHYKPDTIITATQLLYTLQHKMLHNIGDITLVSNYYILIIPQYNEHFVFYIDFVNIVSFLRNIIYIPANKKKNFA